MDKNNHLNMDEISWSPIRPDISTGIVGHSLVPKGATVQSIALTKVGPGMEFPTHTDDYHHVFCSVLGKGEGWSGQTRYEIGPGRVLRVTAGTPHGYRNTSNDDMILITVNYY